MIDEFRLEELKSWMAMYQDPSHRAGRPDIHFLALMARADGLVNTGLISWSEWRELEILAVELCTRTIKERAPPQIGSEKEE